MRNFARKIYRKFGIKDIFIRFKIQYFIVYCLNFIENISLLFKLKVNPEEKKRGIQLLKENDFEDKKAKLKNGLDSESKKNVDFIIDRFFYIATHDFEPLFSKDEILEQKTSKKFTKKISKNYRMSIDIYEPCVFFNHCGLKIFNEEKLNKIKSYLKGKDVIDAGAYVGDSALLFLKEYNIKNVFAFEPESNNYNLLKKTIEINNNKNIIPVKKGLGDMTNEKVRISSEGLAAHVLDENDLSFGEFIEITTIDAFINETKNINVGLIKMDIEGYEFKAIKGAIEIIKKNKPILLISIYHNSTDFLQIKPYLENLNLDYGFFIKKVNPFSFTMDTMLVCVPRKIYE